MSTESKHTELWRRQGCRCLWCGELTWNKDVQTKSEARECLGIEEGAEGSKRALRRKRATKEHLLPKVRGGTNANYNLASACFHCNSGRRDDVEPNEAVLRTLPKKTQTWILELATHAAAV